MQKKQDQKVVLVSLSIHINLEHGEHTKKINKTQTYLPRSPIFLPPHPQQRAVETPPSFPLRRVRIRV